MIDRPRFNYILTNTMAIAHLTLAHKCKQFASEEAIKNQTVGATMADEEINYQKVLESGYAAESELVENYDAAWEGAELPKLQGLLNALPPSLKNIDGVLSVPKFKAMVELTAILPDFNSFDDLHGYCQSLVKDVSVSHDLIREAIADDDLNLLESNEEVDPKNITFEDINTALMVESINVMPWLFKHFTLSDDELKTVIEYVSSDAEYFGRVFPHIRVGDEKHGLIRDALRELDEPETLDAFNALVSFSMKIICVIGLCLVVASACFSDTREINQGATVVNVSDEPFTFKEEKGRFITFTSDAIGECSITMAWKNFKSGVQLRVADPESELDVSCLYNDDLFMLDETTQTFAELSVSGEGKLQFNVKFNLRSPRTKTFLANESIRFSTKIN